MPSRLSYIHVINNMSYSVFMFSLVLQDYREAFVFEKQDRVKGAAGKKRVTYFSDLTLAEADTPVTMGG